jgi:hypothetical protein
MDMKIYVLTCLSYPCQWVWEKNEVIKFGRDKFAWHKQTSFFIIIYKFPYMVVASSDSIFILKIVPET